MKAIVKPRIRLENRPVLQNLIPLNTPTVINVDPSDKCNLRCKFCPTADHELMKNIPGRNHGPMSFILFKKIIDDIGRFPESIKVLRLYKDGEPLLNPIFGDMVRYAKESKCCEVVDTTTNGIFLSPKRNLEIIKAGIDWINISIYGINQEQYDRFSGRKVDFETLVQNIRHLYENRGNCKILVKTNGDIISSDDQNKFYNTFGDIADFVFIEHIMPCWPEFRLEEYGVQANQSVGIYGQPIKEVATCPYIFYSFSINSDGRASACFLDWGRGLIVGDTKTESVVDIWNGYKLREHQMMMLRGKRKGHPICRNCGQMTHGMPDDIDAHSELLLKKLQ